MSPVEQVTGPGSDDQDGCCSFGGRVIIEVTCSSLQDTPSRSQCHCYQPQVRLRLMPRLGSHILESYGNKVTWPTTATMGSDNT